jgi:dienelactone hydrolase
LYLGQQVQEETPEKLSENQRVFVKKAYEETLSTLSVSNRVPTFSFRVGYTNPPTASSLKKEFIFSEYTNITPAEKNDLSKIGIIFISPIIGLTPSMMAAFQPLIKQGIPVVGIDIFHDSGKKKTFWKILSLTMLPGAHSRRIAFANSFPEHKVFDAIESAIKQLIQQGREQIVIGGMSGGFILASRVVQSPPDHEIENHHVRKLKGHVIGLFGISPLIFYPKEMKRPSAHLKSIPSNIRTLLFFGDNDKIIPPKTLAYAKDTLKTHSNIQVKVLYREEFGKPIQHQFFGGKDFMGPMKNPFWNQEAEKYVITDIENFLKSSLR